MRRLCAAAAVAYTLALLGVLAALRAGGERWWITGVALYVPRWGFALPLPVVSLALVIARRPRLLWTQVVAAVVLLFPLMGLVVHLPFPCPRRELGASTLRVLSYNVESGLGDGGYPAVVAEVDRFLPDVAILVAATATDALLEPLRSRFGTVRFSGQFVIASRFPILDWSAPTLIHPTGQAYEARFVRMVLDTPMGRLIGYATHPVSPRGSLNRIRAAGRFGMLLGRAFNDSNAASFYANRDAREAEVAAVAELARRETDPVFIAGDTNLPTLSAVYRQYLSTFDDGFTEAGSGFGYTFPSDSRFPAWMRIDRILSSHSLKFESFEVGNALASDHYCVVAVLGRR